MTTLRRKPDIFYPLCITALCYPKNYREDIGKACGQPSAAPRTVPVAQAPPVLQNTTSSTAIADSAPTPTDSSPQAQNTPNTSQDVDELETQQQHIQQQDNEAPL
ncbi:hypothetical protein Tco_0886187 [Tanacetum coccineum]